MEVELGSNFGDVNCIACADSLPRQHNGVKCSQGHDVCPDCAKMMVETILSDPEVKIPAKC